jgi:hypothetical protein
MKTWACAVSNYFVARKFHDGCLLKLSRYDSCFSGRLDETFVRINHLSHSLFSPFLKSLLYKIKIVTLGLRLICQKNGLIMIIHNCIAFYNEIG